jgi:hypothetical protein
MSVRRNVHQASLVSKIPRTALVRKISSARCRLSGANNGTPALLVFRPNWENISPCVSRISTLM